MPSGEMLDIVCNFDLSIHKELNNMEGGLIPTRHLSMVHSTAELLKHRYLGLDSEGSKVQKFWRSLSSPSPWIIFSANQPGLSCFSKHYHRRSISVFISHSLPRTVNQLGLSVKKTLAPLNRACHSSVSWSISMSNLLDFF